VFNMSIPMQIRTLNIGTKLKPWVIFCHPPSPTKTISWTHEGNSQLESCRNLPIFQFTHLFFGPTKQYVQHWKKVDMCCKFTPLEPSKPYGRFNIWRKLTCWVIAIDLSPGPLQNTLFNILTNLASWVMIVMFEMSFSSPTTKQDVEHMNKIGTSSYVWNLRPLDYTQQYIQHMNQVGM
jgi:hypothetical protein